MNPNQMIRSTNQGAGVPQVGKTLALTTNQLTTQRLDYLGFAGGNLIIPTGSSITTLTFYGADSTDITASVPTPVYDSTLATPVAAVISGISAPAIVPIPDACFGLPYLYIKANAAGNVVFSGKS